MGAPSASAGAAGTVGAAFVSFAGPRPLLGAIDGCNALVAAPSTIAFSTSTKTWVFLVPRHDQGYLHWYQFTEVGDRPRGYGSKQRK